MIRRDDGFNGDLQAHEVLTSLKITALPVNPFAVADYREIMHQEKPSLAPGIFYTLTRTLMVRPGQPQKLYRLAREVWTSAAISDGLPGPLGCGWHLSKPCSIRLSLTAGGLQATIASYWLIHS